jgi:Uma2 family endonuclease
MAVEVEVPRRLFSVEEYHRMAETGILREKERVELAVEVADTTVRFDRLVKSRLYARAGIAEFWLCLVMDGAVEVHRRPGPDGYANVVRHGPGEMVSPLAFPDVSFAVADFFA